MRHNVHVSCSRKVWFDGCALWIKHATWLNFDAFPATFFAAGDIFALHSDCFIAWDCCMRGQHYRLVRFGIFFPFLWTFFWCCLQSTVEVSCAKTQSRWRECCSFAPMISEDSFSSAKSFIIFVGFERSCPFSVLCSSPKMCHIDSVSGWILQSYSISSNKAVVQWLQTHGTIMLLIQEHLSRLCSNRKSLAKHH